MKLSLLLMTLLSLSILTQVGSAVRDQSMSEENSIEICSAEQETKISDLSKVACLAKLDEIQNTMGFSNCSVQTYTASMCKSLCMDIQGQNVAVRSDLRPICQGAGLNVKMLKTAIRLSSF